MTIRRRLGAVTSVLVASTNGNVVDLVVDLHERKAFAERATYELLPDPEEESP